jgi:hypothetical protein
MKKPQLFRVFSTEIVNGYHGATIEWFVERTQRDLTSDLPFAEMSEGHANEVHCAVNALAELFGKV